MGSIVNEHIHINPLVTLVAKVNDQLSLFHRTRCGFGIVNKQNSMSWCLICTAWKNNY